MENLANTAPAVNPTEQTISFYDVKQRQTQAIPLSDLTKIRYNSGTKARYGLRGKFEGRVLVKFVNQATYDSLNVPEEPAKITG